MARFILMSPPSIENRGVRVLEEFRVQHLYALLQVVTSHYETQIYPRSALGNHANVYIFKRPERAPGHSRCVPDVVTHDADDGLIVFYADLGKFLQSKPDFRKSRGIVDRQRNADLRACKHVHGRFRAIEHLKNAMEEPMRHQ